MKKTEFIGFKVSDDEKLAIVTMANHLGHHNISSYIRVLVLRDVREQAKILAKSMLS